MGQESEQSHAHLVRPVQILEDEHERRRGKNLDHSSHGAEEPEIVVRRPRREEMRGGKLR